MRSPGKTFPGPRAWGAAGFIVGLMAILFRLALALGVLISSGRIAHGQAELPYLDLRRVELSGFLGVHISSDTSDLGARVGSRASIASSVAFGPRLTYMLRHWLLLEAELPVSPTNARDSIEDVNVVVIEPRLAMRFEALRLRRFVPFATLGVGFPIALSGNSDVIDNDVDLRLQLGAGVLLSSRPNWNLRVDARFFATPERGDPLVTPEVEISIGLYYAFGTRATKPSLTEWIQETDKDEDGIPDHRDECPERDEDRDGFDDLDGCPDIDNDFDLVLDIADRCPNQAESHNGFLDSDGCPDEVPPEVLKIVGPVRSLSFRKRSARVTRSGRRALRRVARIMSRNPSVRIVVTGHTDSREVRDDPQRLSLRRARAVRDFLVRRKIRAWRVKIAGDGARNPTANNRSRRGRAKNRRVEIDLRVYGPGQ